MTAPPASRALIGVVVTAGMCMNTVKVRVSKQVWNEHLRKNYIVPQTFLVDDYVGACQPGDVVKIVGGLRSSRHKRHVVDAFVSPVRTGPEPRVLPEGVAGWMKRREEKRDQKLAAKLAAKVEEA